VHPIPRCSTLILFKLKIALVTHLGRGKFLKLNHLPNMRGIVLWAIDLGRPICMLVLFVVEILNLKWVKFLWFDHTLSHNWVGALSPGCKVFSFPLRDICTI